MEKQIYSVKVLKNKYNIIVYVNYVDGSQSGERRYNRETKTWTSTKLTDDELKAARAVAYRDGAWHDYRAPREETIVAKAPKATSQVHSGTTGSYDDEDARTDLEAMSKFEHDHRSNPDGFMFGGSKEG